MEAWDEAEAHLIDEPSRYAKFGDRKIRVSAIWSDYRESMGHNGFDIAADLGYGGSIWPCGRPVGDDRDWCRCVVCNKVRLACFGRGLSTRAKRALHQMGCGYEVGGIFKTVTADGFSFSGMEGCGKVSQIEILEYAGLERVDGREYHRTGRWNFDPMTGEKLVQEQGVMQIGGMLWRRRGLIQGPLTVRDGHGEAADVEGDPGRDGEVTEGS